MSSETFVEEEFLGPVDTDTSRAAYLGEKPEVGDSFKAIDKDNYEVKLNANERIAAEVPNLKEENELLKIKLGKALGKETPGGKKNLINIDTSSLGSFASSVGNALTGVAEFLPNKIEEISSDPKKKKNFLRGLNIIAESSGYDPKFRSPFGKVAGGLLKAEESFIAEDLARFKKKNEPRRYASPMEKSLSTLMEKYVEDYKKGETGRKSSDVRTAELTKLAERGIESPTGLIEDLLTPLQKFASELGLGEDEKKIESLITKVKGKTNLNELTSEEKVIFKDVFASATKAGIVSKIKDLYPGSDKDVQILLSGAGDISTNPKALAALVAAEMAAKEISVAANDLVQNIAFKEENLNFEKVAKDRAAVKLANKFKDKVKPETLKAIYGDDPESINNPFRIINAYYYQQVSPKYEKDLSSFDTYLKTKASKIDQQKKLIDDLQKKVIK
jgi:hypothetical protein